MNCPQKFCKNKNLLILILLTLLVFVLLFTAPFLRDFLKNFLGDKNYKIFWISISFVFFILVFYLCIKKPMRLLLLFILFFLFLIKSAPEEKFHIFIFFSIGYFSKKSLRKYGIVYVAALAFIDEILQYFLPLRFFDFKDIILNLGSGFIGFLFNLKLL